MSGVKPEPEEYISPFGDPEFQSRVSQLQQYESGSMGLSEYGDGNIKDSNSALVTSTIQSARGQEEKIANKEKPKILCLHGLRSNNDVSRMHLRNLGLKKWYTGGVQYLESNIQASGPPDPATDEFFDGPFFSWYEKESPDAQSLLLRSLHGIVNYIKYNGPFDCAYGFSQGGALVALLSFPDVVQRLTGSRVQLWRTAILACSTIVQAKHLAETALNIHLNDSIPIPSFHLIGVDDPLRGESEETMCMFAYRSQGGQRRGIFRTTYYVSGGHGVPATLARDKDFRCEFESWFKTSCKEETNVLQAMSLLENILSLPLSIPLFNRPDLKSSTYEQGAEASHCPAPMPRKDHYYAPSKRGGISGSASSPGFSHATPAKGEISLPVVRYDETEESLLQIDGQKHNSVLESLEVLDLDAPLSMTNGMDYRFDTSRLAILFSDPGENNKWYKNLSILKMLESVNQGQPFLKDVKRSNNYLTYGDVLDFISSGGVGDLRTFGIQDSREIVMYMPPPGPAGALLLLTICTQAVAMPLDPESTYDDVMAAIQQVNPSIAIAFREITSESFVNAAKDSGLVLEWQEIADGGKPGLFHSESPNHRETRTNGKPLRTEPSAVVLLLRTSGSTALPKVVPLTNEALSANAVAIAMSLSLTGSDIALNAMPLFHIGGIAASVLATVAEGASLICLPKFEPSSFLEAVLGRQQGDQPTWFTAVPTMHLSLMLYGRQTYTNGLPKHSLRFIRTGAAPLSAADALALSKFWAVNIVSTYSMTEQMPICSTVSQENAGTVGKPLLVSLALVNESNLRPVPWGQPGEICISGASVMQKYWEGTGDAKPFFYIGDRRFFRTGDLGMIDQDCFVYIIGRLKDLIKVGGEQVSPVEVEAVVRKHPRVDVAVVFAVPSPTWGEEVGIAIVLSEIPEKSRIKGFEIGDSDHVIADIKKWTAEQLGSRKMPRYWKVLDDENDLPKTGSGKYIRNGLAKYLGVKADDFEALNTHPVGAPRMSHGLSGLRYLLSVGVMFNHIGAVWQGEDERNPMTFGASFFPGKASTFYFPATVFFVLGGYSLSSALAAKPVRSHFSFLSARLKTLLPLYWFALILALVNLLIICRPSTYSSNFSWQPNMATRQLGDGSFAQCQSGPVELPYGAWLTLTLVIFSIGLQSWFFGFILVGWILYYSWFFSVYFFVLMIFPWIHNAVANCRGKPRDLLIWFVVYTIGVLISAWALGAYYLFDSWEQTYDVSKAKSLSYNFQNVYALSTVLFPPYWAPVVGSGTVAYFWYDYARPNQSHFRNIYATLCDIISAFFLLFQLFMFIDIDWPYPLSLVGKMWESIPEEPHTWDSALDRYVWSVLVERVKTPLIAVWLALLSMPGRSLTARVLEWRPLSQILGPTSYGCFLFHQIICQWYWWATRAGSVRPTEISLAGMQTVYPATFEYNPPPTAFNYTSPKSDYTWWNFPKYYYWFSPLPLPVAWWEFFFVVMLTTLFAMFCNAYVNPPLTFCYLWVCQKITSGTRKPPGSITGLEIVRQCVLELTGEDSYDENFDIQQQGVGSVGLPIFVSLLNSKDERLGLKVSDIAGLSSMGQLAELVEKLLQTADNATGVGGAEDVL